MKYDVDVSPGFIPSIHHHAVYNSSIASSASTSTASVWSNASSQSSDDTSISANSSDYESVPTNSYPKYVSYDGLATQQREQAQIQSQAELAPSELRRNPRRSAPYTRGGCPPTLAKQTDRKVNFVDSLVGRFPRKSHCSVPARD
jgi:PHO85 cyclin-5